jgi:hypothetical protein
VSQMHVSRLLDKALDLLREPFVVGVPASAEPPRRRHRARRSFPSAAAGADPASFGTASAAHRPEATPRRDNRRRRAA